MAVTVYPMSCRVLLCIYYCYLVWRKGILVSKERPMFEVLWSALNQTLTELEQQPAIHTCDTNCNNLINHMSLKAIKRFLRGSQNTKKRIFTVYNPEFEKYITDIFLTKLQLNKAMNVGHRHVFPLNEYKRYLQWRSYKRLRETRWLRIFYSLLSLVEWWCYWTPIVW